MTNHGGHRPESATLFIPLYGKAKVSAQGVILRDEKAEEIWESERIDLPARSMSKWLAYYLSIRAKVFDGWVDEQLRRFPDALVLQMGCGLDSRCLRVAEPYERWIDCDLESVIQERKRLFAESSAYSMRVLDATCESDIAGLPSAPRAIVALEGLSMYLSNDDLRKLLVSLRKKYPSVHLLVDAYTEFGAKASRLKNPVKDVGVSRVYGIDDVKGFALAAGYQLARELPMTPDYLVDQLKGADRLIFRLLYSGRIARSTYCLYELEA